MGPSLAVLAKRAAEEAGHPLEVIAASRFSDHAAREWLEVRGVKTLVADALSEKISRHSRTRITSFIWWAEVRHLRQSGPTWIANTLAPALAAERFRSSRIAALSTANVIRSPVRLPEAREKKTRSRRWGNTPTAAVARERIFEYYSQQYGTHIALLRLSYALDLRYGVIADIAGKVLRGEPIPLASGHSTPSGRGRQRTDSPLFGFGRVPRSSFQFEWANVIGGLLMVLPMTIRERPAAGAAVGRRKKGEGEEGCTYWAHSKIEAAGGGRGQIQRAGESVFVGGPLP